MLLYIDTCVYLLICFMITSLPIELVHNFLKSFMIASSFKVLSSFFHTYFRLYSRFYIIAQLHTCFLIFVAIWIT